MDIGLSLLSAALSLQILCFMDSANCDFAPHSLMQN